MKFTGKLGYSITQETSPGIWEDKIVEKDITGDTLSSNYRFENPSDAILDINLQTKISVVIDTYIKDHFGYIKYVKFQGVAWNVKSVDMQYPRLILTLGGLYNG